MDCRGWLNLAIERIDSDIRILEKMEIDDDKKDLLLQDIRWVKDSILRARRADYEAHGTVLVKTGDYRALYKKGTNMENKFEVRAYLNDDTVFEMEVEAKDSTEALIKVLRYLRRHGERVIRVTLKYEDPKVIGE
jgi:hypothetical protein